MDFNYLYVHTPSVENELLKSSMLTKNGFQVEVDPLTLQSVHFQNVFSIGEGARLPVEPSFFASIYQAHVARQNVVSLLEGRAPSAHYDFQSKLFLPLAPGESIQWKSQGDHEHFSTSLKFLQTRDHEHLYSKIKKVYEGKSHGTWEKNYPNQTSSEPKV